jgi:hypothetical protein
VLGCVTRHICIANPHVEAAIMVRNVKSAKNMITMCFGRHTENTAEVSRAIAKDMACNMNN